MEGVCVVVIEWTGVVRADGKLLKWSNARNSRVMLLDNGNGVAEGSGLEAGGDEVRGRGERKSIEKVNCS